MRLFVALNLKPEEQEEVAAATQPLRDSRLPVRWVEPAAYHLTLKFLGEVSDASRESIDSALRDVALAHPTFPMRLRGAGAFPSPRHPSVWWLGIEPNHNLMALQLDVERAIAPLGFPTEQRAFSPHLTLGRTARTAHPGALDGAESLLQAVVFDRTITVESLDLMRSHLSPRGASYERLLSASLRP